MKFFILILLSPALATVAEPPKAKTCVACHGEKGISANALWPNIAGQKAEYFEKQIKEFRDGKREDQLMTNIAKDLSDQEIKELATYYSKLKGCP